MKSCTICCGSGQVPTDPYRETSPSISPKIKKPLFPKIKLPKITSYNVFLTFMIFIFVIVCVAFPCAIYTDIKNQEVAEAKALITELKQGYITAQYTSNGEVQQCWISRNNKVIDITGSSATITVQNLAEDNSNNAATIGITNLDNCHKL